MIELTFPTVRMRRLRRTAKIRSMVTETSLSPEDLIYPLIVKESLSSKEPIGKMPGQYQHPLQNIVEEAETAVSLGVPAVILFGIPKNKDEIASQAYAKEGIIQLATSAIKSRLGDDLTVITDVCLCEYMSHGHCGIVENEAIINDNSLLLLRETAVSHAEAGADMVAPSSMMDGQVGAIREALDAYGHSKVPIMAYSAKMASNFYAPFREAAESAPSFGNRGAYQMDFSNSDEALREVELDVAEGADIIMVKPALAYLDVILRIKDAYRMPIAAYNVSGEYSMVKAAAQNGWINEIALTLEILTAIKRAGADMILTYSAKEVSRWLANE